jgi:hypothetical protein
MTILTSTGITKRRANRWPDHIRLSDIELRFVCKACGQRGADIRPDWRSMSA